MYRGGKGRCHPLKYISNQRNSGNRTSEDAMTFSFFLVDFGGKLDVERRADLFFGLHRYFQSGNGNRKLPFSNFWTRPCIEFKKILPLQFYTYRPLLINRTILTQTVKNATQYGTILCRPYFITPLISREQTDY